MHLAQFNIARLLAPEDDPRVAGFTDNVARINALAERMPGFVWRWEGEHNIEDDPLMTTTLSVWRSGLDLEAFVFKTLHVQFFNRRREWFEFIDRVHLVMWWLPKDDQPTMAEAQTRLAHLQAHGDTDTAFGWDFLKTTAQWHAQDAAVPA